jgi:hypothetical protein
MLRRVVFIQLASLLVAAGLATAAGASRPLSFSLPEQASEVAPGVFFLGEFVQDMPNPLKLGAAGTPSRIGPGVAKAAAVERRPMQRRVTRISPRALSGTRPSPTFSTLTTTAISA